VSHAERRSTRRTEERRIKKPTIRRGLSWVIPARRRLGERVFYGVPSFRCVVVSRGPFKSRCPKLCRPFRITIGDLGRQAQQLRATEVNGSTDTEWRRQPHDSLSAPSSPPAHLSGRVTAAEKLPRGRTPRARHAHSVPTSGRSPRRAGERCVHSFPWRMRSACGCVPSIEAARFHVRRE